MEIRDGFTGAVGNTPLIRLAKLSAETGCEILGKAEFLNPGGSVKDRAALYIIRDAEKRGALKPGGTARFLKEKNPKISIVLADPHGSALYSWAKSGSLEAEGSSITEGIGTTRITANFEGTPVDDAVRVSDQQAVTHVYRLLREEGLYVGGSTGINVAAAVEAARSLGPGHTVVTLLCDRGSLYFQRLFNPEWLRAKGLDPG